MTTLITPIATTDAYTEVWQRDFTRSIDALIARQTAILQQHRSIERFLKSDIAPILEDVARIVSRYGFRYEREIAADGACLYVVRDVNHGQQVEEGEFTYSLSFAISADGIEALWDDQYSRDKPGSRDMVDITMDDLPADIVYKRFDPPVTSLTALRDRLGEHVTQCFLGWFEEVYINAWLDPHTFAHDRAGVLPAHKHK